jgi:hypothetical protein
MRLHLFLGALKDLDFELLEAYSLPDVADGRLLLEWLAGEDVYGDPAPLVEGVDGYVGPVYDDEPRPPRVLRHSLDYHGARQYLHVDPGGEPREDLDYSVLSEGWLVDSVRHEMYADHVVVQGGGRHINITIWQCPLI